MYQHQTSVAFTSLARPYSWFGNPAIVLEQETRGFAASPRGECAGSSDHVWSALTVTTRCKPAISMLHKRSSNIAFANCVTKLASTALNALRIAMWSGPRYISTARLRAFDSGLDMAARDEPHYAHYIEVDGAGHPHRDE